MKLLTVVFAVASIAFTTTAKTDDFDCTGSLVWYQVQFGNGDDITVSVGSAIDPADLAFLIQNVITDISSTDSITSADFAAHLMSQAEAQTRTCPASGPYVCAVGFKPDATPDGEYKLVTIMGINYVLPKTTGDAGARSVVECIIFQPSQ